MSIYFNGSSINGVYVNSASCPVYYNGVKVWPDEPVYPEPGNYTLRFKFDNTAVTPVSGSNATAYSTVGTWRAVDRERGVWDWTRANTSWNGAFSGKSNTHGFASIIDAGYNSNVNSASAMFSGNMYVTSIKKLNLSKCNNFKQMFNGAYGLVSVNNISTGSGDFTAQQMFTYCTALSSVDGLPACRVYDSAFQGCSSLTGVTCTFYGSGNTVPYTDGMFNGSTALQTVNLQGDVRFNSLYRMFYNCSSLKSVNTTGKIKLYGGPNMSQMFYWCSSLTQLPQFESSYTSTSGGKSSFSAKSAFFNCRGVSAGVLDTYNFLSSTYITSNTANYQSAFRNCGMNTEQGASELSQIPSTWK